jgi:hypothetical protein
MWKDFINRPRKKLEPGAGATSKAGLCGRFGKRLWGRSEGGKNMGGVREEAHKMIDALPEETSWDDLIYQMYVRKKIAKGIEAAEQGRVVPHDEVKKQFLSE